MKNINTIARAAGLVGRVALGSVTALALAGSAVAAGLAPPDYSFLLNGAGNLIRNGGAQSYGCTWNFKMLSGSSVGGSPDRATDGTMTGGNAAASTCSVMTINPSTWSITSSTATTGAGVFHGLNFKENGLTFCSTGADVPFTVANNADKPSTFTFNYANIGSNCQFVANMNTASDLNTVP